jgi:hypothetical protein
VDFYNYYRNNSTAESKLDAIHRFKEQKAKLILHTGDFVFLGIIDEVYFILL